MKHIQEVREILLQELETDISADTIRRDCELGIIECERNEDNDYRVFDDKTVDTIKLITLFRSVGIPREKIKDVLDGNYDVIANAIEKLERVVIPNLRLFLNEATR